MLTGNRILHKKQRVRSLIFNAGIISRKELREKSGLNYRSVVAYAEELKRLNLIAECVRKNPHGGRSSIYYRSRCNQVYVLAVLLYRNVISLVAADVNSSIFYADELTLPQDVQIQEMIREILYTIGKLREKHAGRILGAIELCRFPYHCCARCYDAMLELNMILRQQFPCPVGFHNSYDLALFQNTRNFDLSGRCVLLSPGDDIYVSLVDRNEIVPNMELYSRRFAHHQLSMKAGEPCYCGKRRCVKSLLTQNAILCRYNRLTGEKRKFESLPLGLLYLGTRARQGDPDALRVLEEYGALAAEAAWFLKNDLHADHVMLYFRDDVIRRKLHEVYRQLSGQKLPLFSTFGVTRSDIQSASLQLALSKIIF